MRRSSLFWGIIIILVGVVLLINQFVNINVWAYFWPAVLIFLGLWFLLSPTMFRRGGDLPTENVVVPLDNATEAEVVVHHGAGRLYVRGTPAPGNLLEGSFRGGVVQDVQRSGGRVRVTLRADGPVIVPPMIDPQGLDWNFGLAPDVPMRLELHTGASETQADLENLKVTALRIETGASATRVVLPARAGYTRVDTSSGAASLDLRIPVGVEARIQVKSGLAGISIDTYRFPKNGDIYESAGYAAAENKAEIFVETGVGSVDIR